jgi:hypothetical protein
MATAHASDRDDATARSYGERIRESVRAAERAVGETTPVADEQPAPGDDRPDPDERAMGILREGFGPALSIYVEARTGGLDALAPGDHRALRRAVNRWLEAYAACYGVDFEASFTLQEAATVLVDTRNVRDTAQLLTDVPERHS